MGKRDALVVRTARPVHPAVVVVCLAKLEDFLTDCTVETLPPLPLVVMRFRPAWKYIEGIRAFGEFFCRTTFADPILAERACVVIQETLENATKYSSPDIEGDIELTISAIGGKIEFTVVSTPDLQHLGTLLVELEQLHKTDPEAAFIAAMMRAQREPGSSARLGLARMRYEAGCELTVEEVCGGRIRFKAMGELGAAAKSADASFPR